MFKSTERAALHEIGPRFTLKLKWLKKGLPSVQNLGAAPPPLVLAEDKDVPDDDGEEDGAEAAQTPLPISNGPAKTEEFEWKWKVNLSLKFGALSRLFTLEFAARAGNNKIYIFLIVSYACVLD